MIEKEKHKQHIINILNFYKIPITETKINQIYIYLHMCDKYISVKRDHPAYFLYLSYESMFGKTKEYWQDILTINK